MKKSIIKILLFLLIPILLILIPMMNIGENYEGYENPVNFLSCNSIIEFSGEQVVVTDTYDMVVNTNVPYLYTGYTMRLNLIEESADILNEYEPLIIKAVLDGNEIIIDDSDLIQEGKRYGNSISPIVYKRECSIWTNHLGIEKSGHRKLEITYAYDIKKVVEEYDDICTMKLRGGSSNTKIILPKVSEDLKTLAYGTSAIKESDNTYSFNVNTLGKMFDDEVTILIEKDVITGGKKIVGNYNNEHLASIFENVTQNKNFNELIILLTILITSYILSVILIKKPKFKKEYVRNSEYVIEALLAEALIDSKIGAKEMIMTCVLSAIKKGAVEVRDTETIRLCGYDELNPREQTMISLIFDNSRKEVKIKNLKDAFVKSNEKTKKFYEYFLSVKNSVLIELKANGIYNKIAEIILKIIRIISSLLFVNIIPIMAGFTKYEYDFDLNIYYIIVNIVTIIVSIISITSEELSMLPNKTNTKYTVRFAMLIPCILFFYGIHVLQILLSPVVLIVTILLFVINFITYKNSKKHMLTKKGKEEYLKVLSLKRYIEDYSIMEKRDMEEIVLWDDYLIYATAFGIPNKITNKFAEGLLNTNINLQKINRFLGI